MKKELIMIVFRINVGGLTKQHAENNIQEVIKNMSLRDDQELKENYIIKEFYVPVTGEDSDVKIIYPIPRYTTSPEINELVREISNKIKEDPTNQFSQQWNKLVRELKLRKINE